MPGGLPAHFQYFAQLPRHFKFFAIGIFFNLYIIIHIDNIINIYYLRLYLNVVFISRFFNVGFFYLHATVWAALYVSFLECAFCALRILPPANVVPARAAADPRHRRDGVGGLRPAAGGSSSGAERGGGAGPAAGAGPRPGRPQPQPAGPRRALPGHAVRGGRRPRPAGPPRACRT